jgi:hypothetical protein
MDGEKKTVPPAKKQGLKKKKMVSMVLGGIDL